MSDTPETSESSRIDFSNVPAYHFEIGPVRPPSEGKDRSLLIRVNRNCPWNRCTFCGLYKGKRFEYRSVEEVKADIDVVRAISEGLGRAAWLTGEPGKITSEVLRDVTASMPEIYGRTAADADTLANRYNSLSTVANWLNTGGKTVFFQDANALIMRHDELLEVMKHVAITLPSLERITSYGRAQTINQRSVEQMQELNEGGLERLHVGLESGCNEVLAFVDKGVSGEDHVKAGRIVKAAGISLSEYLMPGLGGRRWSEKHALDSARVLNEINPDYIRLRSLVVRRSSELNERMQAGDFEQLSEDEVVDEIELLVQNLNCTSHLASDQFSNLLWEVEGQLPDDREKMLDYIRAYKSLSPSDRLFFRLNRRSHAFSSIYGGMPEGIAQLVAQAQQAIQAESPDAAEKTDHVIAIMAQGFI